MSRGQVVIKDPPPPEPEAEQTIEERILAARDRFMSRTSNDVERLVENMLSNGYKDLLKQAVGIQSRYYDDTLEFDLNSRSGEELRFRAQQRAKELVSAIDFDAVELTTAQVSAIKRAYIAELKKHVEFAARELAQEDALKVAARVLGIEREA